MATVTSATRSSPPPIRPASNPRNCRIFAVVCSSSTDVCTTIRAGVARRDARARATTVLPLPVGASIIALIILMSITGTCNGHLLTAPRVFYAMAKDGFFFRSMARVHPRYKTPHVAIVVLAAWGAVICTSGTFEQLFTFVMFGYWIFMGLAVGGVIVLRKKRPGLPRPYKAWGYPVTPLLFILAMAFLTVNSLVRTFWNSFAGLGLIAAGIPVYFFWKARGKKARA